MTEPKKKKMTQDDLLKNLVAMFERTDRLSVSVRGSKAVECSFTHSPLKEIGTPLDDSHNLLTIHYRAEEIHFSVYNLLNADRRIDDDGHPYLRIERDHSAYCLWFGVIHYMDIPRIYE